MTPGAISKDVSINRLPATKEQTKPTVSTQVEADTTTGQQVRPEGTFAPTDAQLRPRGGSVIAQTMLDQQTVTTKRRGRGRTGALRMVARQTLMAQVRKPMVRAQLRGVLELKGPITQALQKFDEA